MAEVVAKVVMKVPAETKAQAAMKALAVIKITTQVLSLDNYSRC